MLLVARSVSLSPFLCLFLMVSSSLIAQIHYNELDVAFVSISLNCEPIPSDLKHFALNQEIRVSTTTTQQRWHSGGKTNKCLKKWKCEFRSFFTLCSSLFSIKTIQLKYVTVRFHSLSFRNFVSVVYKHRDTHSRCNNIK